MSTSFAPAGMTDDAEIKTASSITDYIFRRLALDYLSFDDRLELGLASFEDMPDTQASLAVDEVAISTSEEPAALEEEVIFTEAKASKKPGSKDNTAPLCYNCGNQTQRAGSCYVCSSCGSTTGCS
jgi:ribonucleoside-diphosphate reductase alpha chain